MRVRATLVPALALALAASAVPSVGASPSYPVQRDTYGVDLQGLPDLPESTVLATDGAGQLVVTGGTDMYRLTTAGQLVAHAATAPAVTAYATNPARNEAYFTFAGDNVLHVAKPDGTPLADDDLTLTPDGSWGMQPTALAVDPGSPYWSQQVLSASSRQPVVYALGPDLTPSSTQTLIDVIDPTVTSPTYPGQEILATFPVRTATQIAVAPDHSLYLVDASGVVDHYTQQGIFLGSVTVKDGNGNAMSVSALTIDSAGTVFVPQAPAHRIVAATLSGSYLSTFGDAMAGTDPQQPGGFYGPTAVAADCRGVLWVLDTDAAAHKSRLVSFDSVAAPTGPCANGAAVTQTVPAAAGGYLAATDRVGNVFVASYGVIKKFDRGGHLLASWGNPQVSATTATSASIGFPAGLAVTPGGDVLVDSVRFCKTWSAGGSCTATDSGLFSRIVEFHSAGSWVRTLTQTPNGTAWRFLGPLAVRPNGNILVVENADSTGGTAGVLPHTIQEYTPAWASVRNLAITTLSSTSTTSLSVRSLALDTGGNVLAGTQQWRADPNAPSTPLTDYTMYERSYNSAVERWGPTGTPLPAFPGPSTAPLNASPAGPENTGDDTPLSITVLRDGTAIWSTAQANFYPHRATGSLLHVTSTGTILGALRDGLFGVDDAARAALDCAGDLLVVRIGGLARMHVTTAVSCLWKATVTTGGLVSRSTTWLKVRAYANPSAQVTKMRILYGATSAHGKATAWVTLPSDNVTLTRDLVISGLLTLRAYHYAVQVTNGSGTVTGADRTATTS